MVRQEKVLLIPERIFRFLLYTAVFIIPGIFSPGCGNHTEDTAQQEPSSSTPVMSAKNIDVIFSDSGKVQARLSSVLLNRYEGRTPYLEFPRGFKIEIYDSLKHVETTITADYVKRLENMRIMEASGNVVVRNEIKNQQLNTEQLTWDENKRSIYSKSPVKITTADKVLYGKGLESNESFTQYTILHPTGQMMVKKDSI
jgi:LPS export ABC transporter protein LptC